MKSLEMTRMMAVRAAAGMMKKNNEKQIRKCEHLQCIKLQYGVSDVSLQSREFPSYK